MAGNLDFSQEIIIEELLDKLKNRLELGQLSFNQVVSTLMPLTKSANANKLSSIDYSGGEPKYTIDFYSMSAVPQTFSATEDGGDVTEEEIDILPVTKRVVGVKNPSSILPETPSKPQKPGRLY